MTIRDNEPPDRPEIEQMTGYALIGVMQVLAGSAGDAATTRPALRIVAMIVLLSMGTISLTVGRVSRGAATEDWGPGAGSRRHDGVRTRTLAESAGSHLFAPVASEEDCCPAPEYLNCQWRDGGRAIAVAIDRVPRAGSVTPS